MKKYEAVIFDLDGTLLYTLPDMHIAVNHALAERGYPPRTPEEVRRAIGNGVRRLVARSLPGGEENPDFEAVFAAYSEYYSLHSSEHTVPYEGITELLDTLAARGVTTAVVSNKPHADAAPMIRRFFGDRIAVTVGKRPEREPKPAPEAVWEAMEALGIPAEKCVYVGDSEVDLATARNAGVDCVLVTWGYRDAPELADLGAVGVIDAPDALLAYVKER